ncbi:MAG: hypothetical protein ACOC2W_04470, partial [bacterium]
MKYLKTYNELNEGLRDKMVPKDADDIIKSLQNKSPNYKLNKGVEEGVVELVKNAIEEGAEITHYLIYLAIDRENVDILNLLIKDFDSVHKTIGIVKLKKVRHEFLVFLKEIGFNINPHIWSNYIPSPLDGYKSFIVDDFIMNHSEFLSEKH